MKFITFIASMLFTSLAFATGGYNSHNDVPTGTVIQVACTTPGATGATVAGIDNTVIVDGSSATTSVPLPLGVSVGVSCSGALNSLNGTSCGHDAKWVISDPVNLIVNPRKSLQQFTIICTR